MCTWFGYGVGECLVCVFGMCGFLWVVVLMGCLIYDLWVLFKCGAGQFDCFGSEALEYDWRADFTRLCCPDWWAFRWCVLKVAGH